MESTYANMLTAVKKWLNENPEYRHACIVVDVGEGLPFLRVPITEHSATPPTPSLAEAASAS